jgi:sugar fermentation stimulation protein A
MISRSENNMDSGVYILVFYLPKNQQIGVGRIGPYQCKQGVYFYVGSAQHNLSARLKHHARKKKPRRWHIDYISVKSKMLGAIIVPGPREQECILAKKLGEMFELPIPGFGASDCRCGGHLFYASQLT